jgi:catechol 2,3-dioxygenase-like lactoylglutathione lyase family enzyme
MFSHIFVGSTDLARSKTFYDALFAATGGPEGTLDTAKNRLVYFHKGAAFIVAIPINGEPACIANGGTIGFGLENEAQVDAWHAAGVAHGGTPVRIRRACARKPISIWPIFVIPTGTSCAPLSSGLM